MRGTYTDDERAAVAADFRGANLTHFIQVEVEPLRKFVWNKKPLTVIDVGANKGLFSKAMLRLYPVDKCFMFDASPINFKELSRREDNLLFDAEDFNFVSAYHYAMGDKPGTITLYSNEEGSPLGSVYPHRLGEETIFIADFKVETQVPVTTLDWFATVELGLKHIDVLKIDTEGHEFPILQGAQHLISRKWVDTVHFEFGVHQVDSRHFFRDFYTFFRDHGYHLHVINEGLVYPVQKYEYRFEDFGKLTTFIADHRIRD